jgi:fumarate hydratase class II
MLAVNAYLVTEKIVVASRMWQCGSVAVWQCGSGALSEVNTAEVDG